MMGIIKNFFLFVVVGIGTYSASMIIIRLQMTEMAYRFEEAKKYERSLQEEQMRLRSKLAKVLSPRNARNLSLEEPQPEQLRVIPQ